MLGGPGAIAGNHGRATRRFVPEFEEQLVCGKLPATTLPLAYTFDAWQNAQGYNIGCNLILYGIQLATAKGRSVAQAFTDASTRGRGSAREMLTSMAGRTGADDNVVGDWLLSWYADDYVTNTPAELRQSALNLPIASGRGVNSWPTALSTSWDGRALRLVLGEPDARWLQLPAATAAVRLSAASQTSSVTNRIQIGILRTE